MAKKIEKAVKTAKPSRLHHEVKNTDWKFVVTMIVLAIIGLGVFKIYQGLKAENPAIYYTQSKELVRCEANCRRNHTYCMYRTESSPRAFSVEKNCDQKQATCLNTCSQKYE